MSALPPEPTARPPGAPLDPESMWQELYDELHTMARNFMRHEGQDPLLQTTALVSELYLRLQARHPGEQVDRLAFLARSAQAMRRILVDHARRRLADKRGGGRERLPIAEAVLALDAPDLDLLDLDELLRELAARHPRAHQVVELRFFGGLTTKEAAQVLDVSLTTAEDDWYLARAWLRRRLTAGESAAE